MKCQRTACGRDIPEDALFCPYCGKKQQHTAAPKPRKRANGKGSVYRRGKSWCAQSRIYRGGVLVFERIKGGFPTRAAAEEYLDRYTRTGVAPRSMRLIDCWMALQETKKWQALSKDKRSHYGTAWRRLEQVQMQVVGQIPFKTLQELTDAAPGDYYAHRDIKTLLGKLYEVAVTSEALDMAQGRGGDQAAEMTPDGFTFYGGVSHGVEKRSKVRSRIVADQLVKLIKEADHVVIMGHRMSDLDAIGSAEGVLRICKICDVPAVIAVRRDATLAGSLINALIAAGQEDDFIDPKGALPIISQRTLCIVVDTYQLGLVESREILEKCGKVAVIDHHRKGVGFIEKADLVCHEPYASSASELVTEFLQYVGDRDDKPNRIEAEGLLSGIMLDTRDFTLHTGVRTFEAAAALRRYGAETEHVRQLFDVSMVEYTTKAMLVSEAQMYRGCAITVSGEVAPEARVAIAQAANDLLTIQNVEASFVAVQVGGGVNISARSLGAVNVQVIMESLGGGGHQTMAAAQLKHITPEAARSRIQTAIDQYREAQKKSGLESGSEQKKKDKQ